MQSLVEGTPENVRLYFKQLEKVFNLSDSTDKKDYKDYLTKANRAGFTGLHQAVLNGNFNCLVFYYSELERVFVDDKRGLYDFLYQKTVRGPEASCKPKGKISKECSNKINNFLREKKESLLPFVKRSGDTGSKVVEMIHLRY